MGSHLVMCPSISRFLFHNTKSAWLWLIVRLYVGWIWLIAGYDKIFDSSWTGENAGQAVSGFVSVALRGNDVQAWYRWFLENWVLPYADLWSWLIAWGEFLVGIGLILGLFTAIAAFFGAFMNTSYLFAGTVSINPVLLILTILLLLARRVAGYIGFDRPFFKKVRRRRKR